MSRSRSKARRCAVQALYQWQMAGQDVQAIYDQFATEHDMAKADMEYFNELLRGVPGNLSELDALLKPFLSRPLDEVDPVERAILRLGVFELKFKPEIPYKVVINEALEAAKMFGAEQGHRFVNGILDKAAQQLREHEVRRADKK